MSPMRRACLGLNRHGCVYDKSIGYYLMSSSRLLRAVSLIVERQEMEMKTSSASPAEHRSDTQGAIRTRSSELVSSTTRQSAD